MWWIAGSAANLVIAIAYFAIAWAIVRPLYRTGQLLTNRLGTATAAIFFTCAVHHGMHPVHMVLPILGIDQDGGSALRSAFDWHMVAWDFVGAGVAVYYWSLRRVYGTLMDGAKLFDDLKERENLAAELSAKVDERTRELQTSLAALEAAQQEVASSRDAALAASRAKSEFLAVMSHEIRTPMNGVVGLTELLLDGPLSEAQRHHAEGVHASGQALMGILNDILDFSKIEAGKLELEAVDFDLNKTLEDVAGLVADTAKSKGIEVITCCQPTTPTWVRGDVSRLRQILLNLATNAVKFTEAGEISLSASPVDGGGAGSGPARVRMEVTDTEIGIAAAVTEQLFRPFSQADASTTRRYGGTGLGLAICRRLAEAMGGVIGLESQLGKGTTFWLELPFDQPAAAAGGPTGAVGPPLLGRRALVVDDSSTSRVALTARLQAMGLIAHSVATAEAALERLQRSVTDGCPYDVALVDRKVPSMGGLDLGRTVRSNPALSETRLLLLGSAASDVHAVEGAGFIALVAKPVRRSNLQASLLRALSPSGSLTMRNPPAPTSPAVAARGSLLVVEDNVINQEVARGIAAKLGYTCDVVGDGIEALEALERRGYGAVLMDCRMPNMDGFQATEEVRRREAGRRHVPIIAMTAGALREDRERCIDAGMDDYLTKPVKLRQLEAVLERWITGGDAPDGPLLALQAEGQPAR